MRKPRTTEKIMLKKIVAQVLKDLDDEWHQKCE